MEKEINSKYWGYIDGRPIAPLVIKVGDKELTVKPVMNVFEDDTVTFEIRENDARVS